VTCLRSFRRCQPEVPARLTSSCNTDYTLIWLKCPWVRQWSDRHHWDAEAKELEGRKPRV
jgi:hypothetical protein